MSRFKTINPETLTGSPRHGAHASHPRNYTSPSDVKGTVNPYIMLPRVGKEPLYVLAATLGREIAVYHDDLNALADAYEVPAVAIERLMQTSPILRQEIAAAKKDLRGLNRIQVVAQDIVLSDMALLSELIHSEDTPASIKLKAFELAAQLGGVLNKGGAASTAQGASAGAAVTILINGDVKPPPIAGATIIDQEQTNRVITQANGDTDDELSEAEEAMAAQFMAEEAQREREKQYGAAEEAETIPPVVEPWSDPS